MVKNTRGGTGAKSLARKNVNHDFNIDSPPLPQDQFQRVVTVVKMLGNGIVLVKDFNNLSLFAHLRNLSRRRISLAPNDHLLVSLRPFEHPPKHADVLFVYHHLHLIFISSFIPPVHQESSVDISFEEKKQEETMLDSSVPAVSTEEISIDDI